MEKRKGRPPVAPPGSTPKPPNDPLFHKQPPEPISAVRVAGSRAPLLMPIISLDEGKRSERRTAQEFVIPLGEPTVCTNTHVTPTPQTSYEDEVLEAPEEPPCLLVATPVLLVEQPTPPPPRPRVYEPSLQIISILAKGDENRGAVLLCKPEFVPSQQIKKEALPRSRWRINLAFIFSKFKFFTTVIQRIKDKWDKRLDEKMGL